MGQEKKFIMLSAIISPKPSMERMSSLVALIRFSIVLNLAASSFDAL